MDWIRQEPRHSLVKDSERGAKGLIFSQMAVAVSLAASLTAGLLCMDWIRQEPRHSLVKDSERGAPSIRALAVARPARASGSSLEAHLATRPAMLAARPDSTTPSALTASTIDEASSSDNFESVSSIDIVF